MGIYYVICGALSGGCSLFFSWAENEAHGGAVKDMYGKAGQGIEALLAKITGEW